MSYPDQFPLTQLIQFLGSDIKEDPLGGRLDSIRSKESDNLPHLIKDIRGTFAILSSQPCEYFSARVVDSITSNSVQYVPSNSDTRILDVKSSSDSILCLNLLDQSLVQLTKLCFNGEIIKSAKILLRHPHDLNLIALCGRVISSCRFVVAFRANEDMNTTVLAHIEVEDNDVWNLDEEFVEIVITKFIDVEGPLYVDHLSMSEERGLIIYGTELAKLNVVALD